MNICEYCNREAKEALIINGTILHEYCIKAFKQKEYGRPHECPQCKTSGIISDKTTTITKYIPIGEGEYAPCAYNDCRGCSHCGMKPIEVYPKITCPTCTGNGYTAVKYEPIVEPTVVGYKEKK